MIELNLQMFGGRGGGSGNIPAYLNSDQQYLFHVTIHDGKKVIEDSFIGANWEAEQYTLRKIEEKGLTYKQYMRGTKYSVSVDQVPETSQTLEQYISKVEEPESRVHIRNNYFERKKKYFSTRKMRMEG